MILRMGITIEVKMGWLRAPLGVKGKALLCEADRRVGSESVEEPTRRCSAGRSGSWRAVRFLWYFLCRVDKESTNYLASVFHLFFPRKAPAWSRGIVRMSLAEYRVPLFVVTATVKPASLTIVIVRLS